MKLLYIANSRIPTEKAHGLQIIKTIEAFQLLGLRVETLLPHRKNYIKQSIEDYYNIKTKIETRFIKNYFGWLEGCFYKLYFFLQRISFGTAAFFYALRSGADAIYSREITICFFLSLSGRPVIFEDHEPKKRMRWLYKIFVKRIKKKVVVARNLVELYESFGVDKGSYIEAPNGVDLAEFNNVKPDKSIWQKEFGCGADDKVVLYVGHFYSWKGVYTLLDAAQFINGIVILIGGIPQDKDKVQSYIEEKRLTNVRVHEFMPHAQIIKFIKSADVLVLPNTAREERSAKYTTPIKLFEYMASNVPIVASRIESFLGYLQDDENALLCESDNPGDLAEKINLVLEDKGLADRLAKKALVQSIEYNWKKRAEKIINFIKD